MTRPGARAARRQAATLPAFESLDEARPALFQLRDRRRRRLQRIAAGEDVRLDDTPDSLKTLEKWYFELCDAEGFARLGITREEFEHCMGNYVGFVYTENSDRFDWIVLESVWIPGRFEIAVTNGFLTKVVGPVTLLHKLRHNKRRQSMFREYRQYSAT